MTHLAIRRVLLPLACHGSESRSAEEAAAEAAGALAGRFGAHVTAFLPLIDPKMSVAFVGEGATGAIIENLIEAAEKENEARKEYATTVVREHLAAVPHTLCDQMGREGDVLAAHARVHDISVLSRGPADRWTDTGFLAVVESLVIEGGKPLLLAPASSKISVHEAPARATVAWTDTAEAARALAFALPLLGAETQVTVLGVDGVETDGAVALLNAHGLKATAKPLELKDHSLFDDHTGDAILGAAEADKSELIIMGAFIHSRLRQLIVGGPTRTILRASGIPVLLAH